ncbi:MAG: VCBS repeat-containing protein [Candidatus Hydrogenedentes bacterium]|nr:VCBS repeat-containing protein [Candidatus Hydrogenedentota bacterium]
MNLPMRLLLSVVAALSAAVPGFGLPQPVEEWTLDTKLSLGVSPIAFPTGKPDSIVLGFGGNMLRISGNGEILWHAQFGPDPGRGGLYEACSGDLNGDGIEEIIGGHKNGLVVALDSATGAVLWEFDLGSYLDSWEMARARDLDGDGRAEVVASAQNGWIYCLNGDGQMRWRSRMEPYLPSTVSIGDINGDGRQEIVYGTATRHLIALNDEGQLLWDAFLPPHHLGRTAPLLADLDNDGAVEIYSMSSMIALDAGVVSLNGADGSLRWVRPHWSKSYLGRAVMRFEDGARGVLTCDKGNHIAAYTPDGSTRWHVQLNGRGIHMPPAVADVDGDGADEVLVTVRDHSTDGKHVSWYILNARGETIDAYDMGDGFCSPLVADIDQDGVLEVVLNSRDGKITAYSFGGAAREGAVVHTAWPNENLLHAGAPPATSTSSIESIPSIQSSTDQEDLLFGNRSCSIDLPKGLKAVSVELTTTGPNGLRQIERWPVTTKLDAALPIRQSGKYKFAFRVLDQRGAVLSKAEIERRIRQPYPWNSRILKKALHELRDELKQTGTATALEMRTIALEADLTGLLERIKESAGMTVTEQDALAEDVVQFEQQFLNTWGLFGFGAAGTPENARFTLWQDSNPWDDVSPESEWVGLAPDNLSFLFGRLPERQGNPADTSLDLWAFGNEIESVCVNVLNLDGEPLTLRVEPGTIKSAAPEAKPAPIGTNAKLMRTVWQPSKYGDPVPDLLPSLADSYLVELAPSEVKQIWINVNTDGLAPGKYELVWPVRTMDAAAETRNITVNLDVSPVTLPEKSRFLLNTWARNDINGFNTIPDLNEHLATVWYGLPLPAMKADAKGNIIDEGDWTAHDRVIKEAKQVELILYGGIPVPAFAEGVQVTDELKLAGQRSYTKHLVAHLAQFGLGYDNFMIYVEDEPGLTGSIASYMERARAVKAIDPRLQNYANPWETVSVEVIEEMWPVTDVWQPGMETIEYLGPDYVAAMKKGGKRVFTYTPVGAVRVVRPLGFFRAQAWMAFHWGITGGGWWVYYGSEDFWATEPGKEPPYGAVTFDGRALVTTRRWEATRDGIEDFNALTMLQELATRKNDAAALQVLDDAVNYVASETIIGMPLPAGDYDVDFQTFQEHRQKIREALERLQR